jgi:Rrf2 family nitric oxide-sensitive transcriptional repressor
MRLTVMSDYSLRVLRYLAVEPGRRATIQEIATAYQISENHLMKVVHNLAQLGFVATVRGRGGLTLGKPAAQITIGAVLRATEDDFALVECFGSADTCRITSACRLKRVLQQALRAYFDVLDQSTLADLVAKPKALAELLDIREQL